jgi:hypothetical protein
MSKEANPVLHYRGTDGYWYKQNGDTMTNTGRPHEGLQGSVNYERLDPITGQIHYAKRGGGRKSRCNARARRNSKKQKRVRHTRRKQTRRHRHSRRR